MYKTLCSLFWNPRLFARDARGARICENRLLGQHWRREWLVAWQNQANIWTNVSLSSTGTALITFKRNTAKSQTFTLKNTIVISFHQRKHSPDISIEENGASCWRERLVNTSARNDPIWRHRTWLILDQELASRLMAQSNYLTECWLSIQGVLWQSPEIKYCITNLRSRPSAGGAMGEVVVANTAAVQKWDHITHCSITCSAWCFSMETHNSKTHFSKGFISSCL